MQYRFNSFFRILFLLVLVQNILWGCCAENEQIHVKPIYKSNSVSNQFGTLLGSGRSLSFPFATGLILSIVTENLWNVSTSGFETLFDIPTSSVVESYSNIFDSLKKDQKSSFQSFIYQNSISIDEDSPAKHLDKFDLEFSAVNWANNYWDDLDGRISNGTNGKLKSELIPTVFGRIFDLETEAAIMNTFHHKNSWKYEWTKLDILDFGDTGENGSFIETEGDFLVSSEDEFTAIAVPLEDEKKSVVFVLPTYNLTRYFRIDDKVPLPQKWVKHNVKLRVPEINFTRIDQYGKELQQLGINETFCTTIHDKIGKFPYYLRPVVQANYVDLNSEFFEMASATGSAIEKFILGADITGHGYPLKQMIKNVYSSLLPNDSSSEIFKTRYFRAEETEDSSEETSTQNPNPNQKEYIFDRPFLWYVDDSDVGPIYFGFVNSLLENNSDKTELKPMEIWKKEFELLYTWSCRSFVKTPPSLLKLNK